MSPDATIIHPYVTITGVDMELINQWIPTQQELRAKFSNCRIFNLVESSMVNDTVDGRNPAPPNMYETL